MLQRFRRAARLTLRPIFRFRRRGTTTTKGGGAFWLDRDEQRVARRVAFLQRILGVKPTTATPRPPVSTTFARQRPPPRPDHR